MTCSEIKRKVEATKRIIAESNVYGCITGSSMLDVDYGLWPTAPDVDFFAYTEASFSHAVMTMLNNGYKWGDGSEGSAERCRDWYVKALHNWFEATQWKNNQGAAMITLKFNKDGVIVNITWKKGCDNVFEVIKSFDMNIIMVGYDVETRAIVDLRRVRKVADDENIGVPVDEETRHAHLNPLRKINTSIWNHWKWVRQCDRPMSKYQERRVTETATFDCVDVVKSYDEMITADIAAVDGPIDNPDVAKVIEDMKDIKAKMDIWLMDKEMR